MNTGSVQLILEEWRSEQQFMLEHDHANSRSQKGKCSGPKQLIPQNGKTTELEKTAPVLYGA